MIVVTGGAGFIGSVLINFLNGHGLTDILIVDSLGSSNKWQNLNGKLFDNFIHKKDFFKLLEAGTLPKNTTHIIHLGACSSTMEPDLDYLMDNNYKFSRLLAELAKNQSIPFIYASSAATYGDGTNGFDDNEEKISVLKPLNGYGFSKHIFDLWILKQKFTSQVVGLKFFNVFGPNEYHKGPMRSLIEKAYFQILETNQIKLFKSEHPDYKDGEQKRDFVYVKDICEIIYWFVKNQKQSGIYNLGSGTASSWLELSSAIFSAMNKKENIEFIDLPENLKGKYQYYTKAPIEKLRNIGCNIKFTPLKDSVNDYVVNYLSKEDQFL
jgi:ADP-L-glycero-D-manno-heptose 6-epimerase